MNSMNSVYNELVIFREYFHIWNYLSKQDIKSRFRRSKLGFLWLVIQQLSFSLGAGVVWATVFHQSPGEFIPFLTIGLTVWGFISGTMLEGCGSLVIAHGYLKQLPLPQSIFIFRTLQTQLFFLGIGLLTAISILAIFGKLNLVGIIYCIPGLCLLLLYAYAIIGTMAYLGLRYRDLQHALTGIFSLLFIVTPVLYPSEILIERGLSLAVYLNPFASIIDIVRYPLLHGQFADSINYLITLGFFFVLVLIRFILATNWGRFVPFWS